MPVCRLRLLSFGIAERTQLAEPGTSQSELGWLRGFNDHYQIGQQLGRGSFGTVSLATETATGQECAVKVIPKQRSAQNRRRCTRCLQSSSWQAAAHQNLIDVPFAIRSGIFAFFDGDKGQKKPYICHLPQPDNPCSLDVVMAFRASPLAVQRNAEHEFEIWCTTLMSKQPSVQVSQVICCCLCRQGATVEHILSKIQQEVDILRRMQGRPEALRLHAVFEVGRGCCWGLAPESSVPCRWRPEQCHPRLQCCRAADFAVPESCIRPSDRCTDWASLLPRGAAHVVVQGCCIPVVALLECEAAQRCFGGRRAVLPWVLLFNAALTAWTSQSCPYRAVSVCSHMQSTPCCWPCRMTSMPTWSQRSATAVTWSSFCRWGCWLPAAAVC